MPTIKKLLTDEEFEKCFPYKESYLYNQIETLTVKQLIEISFAILPLIYPNGIVKNKNVLAVSWKFLNKKANKLNLKIVTH